MEPATEECMEEERTREDKSRRKGSGEEEWEGGDSVESKVCGGGKVAGESGGRAKGASREGGGSSVAEGGETSASIVGGGARVESDAESSSYPSYSSSPSYASPSPSGSHGLRSSARKDVEDSAPPQLPEASPFDAADSW